jgi:hypothetical protein
LIPSWCLNLKTTPGESGSHVWIGPELPALQSKLKLLPGYKNDCESSVMLMNECKSATHASYNLLSRLETARDASISLRRHDYKTLYNLSPLVTRGARRTGKKHECHAIQFPRVLLMKSKRGEIILDVRRFLITNMYIVAIAWFAFGFTWMAILATMPGEVAFAQLLPAFVFTIAGNIIFWIASHLAGEGYKMHVPRSPRRYKGKHLLNSGQT